MKYTFTLAFLLWFGATLFAQNPLYIPPVITGKVIQLNVQSGSTQLYSGVPTQTYGVNGVWMAPTVVVHKGDSIQFHVKNQLNVNTTMHWHGLHVSAMNDGGPHQMIMPGMTWSPSFTIRNNASTFWYHPHGAGQTDLQVTRGISGFFIVKDSQEAALNLPRTYGVDDIPLNIQTRAFDQLKQIAIATDMDTAVFVNGTRNALLHVPAQVIRFRLLNGSSMRSYLVGFSNGQSFYQIGTDGGLTDTPYAMTRLKLSPGERAEILVNLSGMNGQQIRVKSFSSKFPPGIYGADSVGDEDNVMMDYMNNPLNGVDFDLLSLLIDSATANPVTSIPNSLIPYLPLHPSGATMERAIVLDTIRLLPADIPNRASGPFGINNQTFSMDEINAYIMINTTEIWSLINNTLVAHPFHIHDVQFNVLGKNGQPPLPGDRGWKDVVLVMPGDTVRFITRFETFTDMMTPYMYHCHLLHHEDDGMMGSFAVVDSMPVSVGQVNEAAFVVYPNPVGDELFIRSSGKTAFHYEILNVLGERVKEGELQEMDALIPIAELQSRLYFIRIRNLQGSHIYKFFKE